MRQGLETSVTNQILVQGSWLMQRKVPLPISGGDDGDRHSFQLKDNRFTEMCSGSEAGLYLRLIDLCFSQLYG